MRRKTISLAPDARCVPSPCDTGQAETMQNIKNLSDGNETSDYEYESDCDYCVTTWEPDEGKEFELVVMRLDSAEVKLPVRERMQVKQLRGLIEEHVGVHAEKQTLVGECGKVYHGEARLCDCGLGAGASVQLIVEPSGSFLKGK